MTYILSNSGYEVTALYNGAEVIKYIKKVSPDLVILDITLPDADGRDICKAIKNNLETKHLPVIICSARQDLNMNMHQDGSPDDVLGKPFDTESLVNMVACQLAA